MIFSKEKWPVLGLIEDKANFEQAFLSKYIKSDHNPLQNKDSWNAMWVFWDKFINEDPQHFYVSKKIHHLVDYDEKMYPILQEEVYKPEYHRPFFGTINYTINVEGQKSLPFTLLLDIPSLELTEGKHYFALAVFGGTPAQFMGMLLGEDYGDKANCMHHIGDMAVLKAINENYTFCKQFLYFIDHVETQEKYTLCKNNKKLKTSTGEKYLTNLLDLEVNVIDSTYYTRTVSTGEFKVSGHWRLQPCGPRNAHRKLKWIDEFVKHGMTRKAKTEI